MSVALGMFLVLGFLMIASSLLVVVAKNPVTSAMFLVGQLFLLACMYAFMGADFVAAIQVIVYAGAIMVLFVFVIMLLNLQPEDLRGFDIRASEVVVLLLTIMMFSSLCLVLFSDTAASVRGAFSIESIKEAGGNTYVLGMELFSKYLWPFELASILILLAIVAAITIAKRKSPSELKAEAINGSR